MKKLDTKRTALKKALDITPLCKEAKIFRFKLDCYAVKFESLLYPSYAFRSETFSRFINTLESPIVDIIATQSECLLCGDRYADIELTIILRDGSVYRIDDEDSVVEITPLTMVDKEDQPCHQAHEILDLPNRAPYNRMLLSKGFYNLLIPTLKNSDAKTVANQIWEDFKSVTGGPYVHRVGWAQGKFTKFAFTEMFCGRILFLTIIGGHQIEFPESPYKLKGADE